jgi:hypothetical protein
MAKGFVVEKRMEDGRRVFGINRENTRKLSLAARYHGSEVCYRLKAIVVFGMSNDAVRMTGDKD